MRRYLGAALVIAAAACSGTKSKPPVVQTAVVTYRDIIVDAQATGVVEPINVIEVKSKAGGAILKMPVETGVLVKPGDLLVQVDPRDAQNRVNLQKASLDAAQVRLNAAEANKKRQDDLFKARVITALEHEGAATDYENAKSALISAKSNLDIAQQALEDATVTAPASGTVIDKTVSVGTVIASATNSVSGGTTLLKMADLNTVRIRAAFNEADIGSIRGGQPASVTFDAYQNRTFQGLVEKIEPQAVVQQNVTMFPVLITLDNREGLLKPGMNGEVSVLIDERAGVLAVPNDALKNPREAAATATLLGLNPDSVQMEVRAQGAGGRSGGFNRGGTNGGGANGNGGAAPGATPAGAPATGTPPRTSGGEVALASQGGQQDPQQGDGGRRGGRSGRGGGFQMPQASEADCAKLDAEWKKHPKEKKQIDDIRAEQQKARESGADREAMGVFTNRMREIYQTVGIDMMMNGACRRLRGEDGGGRGNGGANRGGNAAGQAGQPGRTAGAQGGAQLQPSPEMGGQRQRTRTGLVFVAEGTTFHARIVQLGQANFDYTEVLGGLKDGEKVALLASLALQVQRQQQNDRNRQNANPLGGNPGGGRGPGGPGGGGPGGGGPGGGGGGAGGRGGGRG